MLDLFERTFAEHQDRLPAPVRNGGQRLSSGLVSSQMTCW